MFFETIDVLTRDPQLVQAIGGRPLQDVADVDLVETDVSVGVAGRLTQLFQLLRIDLQDHAFGHHGHTVAPSERFALDHRPDEGVDDRAELQRAPAELLGNECDGGARGLADAEREVTGLAPHQDRDIPARRRPCVDHQVLEDIDPEMPSRLISEGVDVRREIEVVVDGLGYVQHLDAAGGALLDHHGGERRIVAADGDQPRDAETEQGLDAVFEQLGVLGRIGSRGADVRATPEVHATHRVDRQRLRVLDVALHDPLEAFLEAEHLVALERGSNGRSTDDAVDSGSGAPAYEDRDPLLLVHAALLRFRQRSKATTDAHGRECGFYSAAAIRATQPTFAVR